MLACFLIFGSKTLKDCIAFLKKMTKITIVDRMEMGKEEDRDVQKKVHHFYSSVLWLHPGPVNPVSHPHQTMHPPTHKKKKKTKETYKVNMFVSFWRLGNHSLWVGNHTGVCSHDISLKTVTVGRLVCGLGTSVNEMGNALLLGVREICSSDLL